jgi:hypothetical protein
MIRPFTFVTMLMAAGSGLYLYQTKQAGRVLDRQIDDARAQAAATHQRAEVLRAEYTLLNDPTRLAGLVSAHLPDLKPTQPGQWTSMAELDKRLPAIGDANAMPSPLESPLPESAAPAGPPVAATTPLTPAAPSVAIAEPRPLPAARPATPHPAALARTVAQRPIAAFAHDAAPLPRHAPPRAVAERPAPTRVAHRATVPAVPTSPVIATLRPAPAAAPLEPAAMPVVASALGMARTMLSAVTPANAAGLPPVRDGAVR